MHAARYSWQITAMKGSGPPIQFAYRTHFADRSDLITLQGYMRLDAKTHDLSKIQVARLERSGDISFIKAIGVKQQAA